jgi:hypothetical protein
METVGGLKSGAALYTADAGITPVSFYARAYTDTPWGLEYLTMASGDMVVS